MPSPPPWDATNRFRFRGTCVGRASHEEVEHFLAEHQDAIPSYVWDHSYEGRNISRVDLGEGPHEVAIWTQMHGDEPTHTLVMLELLHTMAHDPPDWAQTILQRCRISVLLMLNPDGATRWTRRNAQDIDINRDARQLATPEGRALRRMIDQGNFEFALNLHNQNPRRTITPGKSAACSLLVPPADEQNTISPTVARAQQWASYVANSAAAVGAGMISRYDADYMPRCFGEWVQSQAISTLLVEAGGFAGKDIDWLLSFHYGILAHALWSIAASAFDRMTGEDYSSLPRNHEEQNFDFVIRNASTMERLATIDIGINLLETAEGLATVGTLAEIGDIGKPGLHQTLAADDLRIAVGNVALVNQQGMQKLDLDQCHRLVRMGVTSVLLSTPLDDLANLERLQARWRTADRRLNVGLLGQIPRSMDATEVSQMVHKAWQLGFLGLLASDETSHLTMTSRLPTICVARIPGHDFEIIDDFHIRSRHFVGRDQVADLIMTDADGNVRHVVLNGKLVFSEGVWLSHDGGLFVDNGQQAID